MGLLDRRYTTFWVKNENGDIGLVSQAVDSSTAAVLSNVLSFKYNYTHLPVSPLVAPTTVNFSGTSPDDFFAFLRFKKNSNRLPKSCNATSLNANVGPWKSSRMNFLSFSLCTGVTSGCLKVLYDFSTS